MRMENANLFRLSALIMASLLSFSAGAQDGFVLDNPGKLFKKQDHRQAPPLKTRYIFGVGEVSGREYLKQQDLVDPKGNVKSSGLFSEDGNKSGDLRYTYDAAGKLTKTELKFIGKNIKEVTQFDANGKAVKKDVLTKTDSLINSVTYVYHPTGQLKEEQTFRGDKLIRKEVYDNEYNAAGKETQQCRYQIDSAGARVPHNAPMTISEYDNEGLILQRTVYNNKEKRKMMSWIYYKYQLDNDYKVIKQTGFNEEQQEIYRNELSYTDSSIISVEYKMCSCPEKKVEKAGSRQLIFNKFGEKTKELVYAANGDLTETRTWLYDDFGNMVENQTVKVAEPAKLIKSKMILEFQVDQAQTARKPTK